MISVVDELSRLKSLSNRSRGSSNRGLQADLTLDLSLLAGSGRLEHSTPGVP